MFNHPWRRTVFYWVCFVFVLTPTAFGQIQKETTLEEVLVTGEREKRKNLSAVEGTKIYRGKKTALIDLKEAPAIINSNYRQALQKTPGLLLSEETTPLISLGYRGLDPHRAQFTQIMKDGIPIHADMFGYPEAYYTPALQVVDHIDFIHGGGALLYGPQPGGALNYVTKSPHKEGALQLTEENALGSFGLYSNYTSFSGTQPPMGYYGYFHQRQSQGFRDNNSQFEVFSGGSKFTVEQTPTSQFEIAIDAYNEEHGEPGGLTRADFDKDPTKTNRLNDRFELNRYAGSIGYEKEFNETSLLDLKWFGGYYERLSWRQRSSASSNFGTVPSGANASSNDIESQEFYTSGIDARMRQDYHLFSNDHILTTGFMYYHSTSPRQDKRGTTADADDGTIRKDADRQMNYVAFFLENLFQFEKLAIIPAFRLENIWQSVKENINLDKTTVPLVDETDYDFVPLAGLGFVYELNSFVELFSNISQSYRPKIFTQAVPTGSGQTANEDLQEGKSWQAEIGLRGEPLPYLYLDTSVFYMEFKDQIGTVGTTGAVVQNVGDARHVGWEITNEFDLLSWLNDLKGIQKENSFGSLNLFVNGMILDAEFTDGPNEGKTPQYAPEYLIKGGAEYQYPNRGKIRLAGTFLDDHFANDSNSASFFVPSYKVWDLTGELNVYKDSFLVFAGINNVFDEHYFARIRADGIDPVARRNFYGGAKIVW